MEENKPDKLAQDVAKAKAAGMSYGKWKALQPHIETPAVPDGWRKCGYCRKPFKGVQWKRFCDAACQKQAYRERKRKGAL